MKTVSARGLITNFRGDPVPIDEIQHAEIYEITTGPTTQTSNDYQEAVEMVAQIVHEEGAKMSDDTPRAMSNDVEEKIKEMEAAPAMAM